MSRTRVFGAWVMAAGLVLCMGVMTAAAGEIGLRAIEGRVGFADLEGDGGSTFILSGGADLGNLTPNLRLEGNVDFWTKSWDGSDFLGGTSSDFSWTWTMFGVIGNLVYDFKTESSFQPFVFGGLGFQYLKSSVDCTGCDNWFDTSTSGLEFGLNLGGGADFGSGEGMTPTVRAGFNTNGGADYLYIQGGLKFPVGRSGN